jgi:hypothetical protein
MSFLELQENINRLLPAVEDFEEFCTTAVTNAHDVAQGNSLAGHLGGDCPAEEAVVVEDTDLSHVARAVPDYDVLADVSGTGVVFHRYLAYP